MQNIFFVSSMKSQFAFVRNCHQCSNVYVFKKNLFYIEIGKYYEVGFVFGNCLKIGTRFEII